MVPCRACLWFLLNLGSVPLSEGYLCVLGFLILCRESVSNWLNRANVEQT
jgi:hypothetical protein